MKNAIPYNIIRLVSELEKRQYHAFIVGGAVRDLLMAKQPTDYDVATSACPKAIIDMAVQNDWRIIDKLGHNFGVVIILLEGQPVEVASFRGERYGADSHKPEEVWFTDNIAEDLARRDFTINAMAMDLAGNIIDHFGGQADLEAMLVRAVGDPCKRFQEDALRMFRACRFAGQLGFDIEEQTLNAIPDNLSRVNGLSIERVKNELEKMLTAEQCHFSLAAFVESGLAACSCRMKEHGEYRSVPILPELTHLVKLPQNLEHHLYDVWRHTIETVRNSPPDLLLRWAALLHDVGKGLPGIRGEKNGQPTDHGHDGEGARLAEDILARFQYSPKFRKRVAWLISKHMRFYVYLNGNSQNALRWIRDEARSGLFSCSKDLNDAFMQLTELCKADIYAAVKNPEAVADAAAFGKYLAELIKDMPVHTSDLPYSAGNLTVALGDKKLIGPFLKNALLRVQDGNLANEEKALLDAAAKWVQRHK